MARVRTVARDLARLFNAAARPIYVLDDEQTIVFCNKACLEWVGRTADEMEGRRCLYHSSSQVTGPDAVAAGLCPSPEVVAGKQTVGIVCCPAEHGRLRRRGARFIPLGNASDDLVGLIAVVEPEDRAEGETPRPEPDQSEADWLHDQIRRFRHQFAAQYRADRLIGDSHAMRRARAQVALAAVSGVSVVVVGPPGSGRQHLARAIHYAGHAESAGSLIPLACAVLGVDLIRSTVTALAARRKSPGEIGQGTLLLNDADELPLEVQADLARVLSARSFPLRLIATARQSLAELAREDRYRGDLATVLSTIVIELPPLAQRREDVPLLAQLFLEEANARGARQVAGFSSEALDRLHGYWWPGNVDELAQTVAEAHRRAETAHVGVADLPERIHLAAEAEARPRRPEEQVVLDEFLERIEGELIRRALARAKGNKTKAANLLGMSRARFHRRLNQLGLEE